MNSFTRGGDIKRTIGIGLLEALKENLVILQNHKAVESIYTSSFVPLSNGLTAGNRVRTLHIKLDLKGTGYSSPDEFLLNYLPREFFSRATAKKENGEIVGISENLALLRKPSTEFSFVLHIRPEYDEDFPTIDLFSF